MKTLIIHHLEMTWETGYQKYGLSFDELARKTIAHIKRAKYDRVILTQFENWKAQEEHYNSGLADFVDTWHDYSYGWYLDDDDIDLEKTALNGGDLIIDKYENKYCNGGNHSDYVLITDWMQELKNDKVRICGAFDGECIEDLEIALNGCGVKFERVESLIV